MTYEPIPDELYLDWPKHRDEVYRRTLANLDSVIGLALESALESSRRLADLVEKSTRSGCHNGCHLHSLAVRYRSSEERFVRKSGRGGRI